MITVLHRPAWPPQVATPHSRMSKVRRRCLAMVAVAAALACETYLPAFAVPGQTSSDTAVANVQVPSAISLTGLTPSFTLVGLPGATVTSDGAVTFTVETNNVAGYSVTVQAESAVLSPAGSSPDNIPIAALGVRETGGGAFTAVSSTSTVTVHTQSGRSVFGGDALSNDYQVVVPFVASDTYSVTLDYVAATL